MAHANAIESNPLKASEQNLIDQPIAEDAEADAAIKN